ncbi:MAG: hypothetical protein LBH43_03905 [Treponema sp.]|jgi:hypothetical protein|nr:hypothetical protein [Treponema sp.]
MKKISGKSIFYAVFGLFAALMLGALVFAACLQPVDPQDFIKAMTGTGGDEIIITSKVELEDAIKDQANGQKWLIKNGAYNVQLDIHTDITVRGESRTGVIIAGPDSDIEGFDALSTYYKSDYSSNLAKIFGLVIIRNGCKAAVSNLTVNGNNGKSFPDTPYEWPFKSIPPDSTNTGIVFLCGIGIVGAEAVIDNVIITNINNDNRWMWGNNGNGIVAAGGLTGTPKDLEIKNCIIKDFYNNGVVVLKGVGYLNFTDNTVTGSSPGLKSDNENEWQNGLVGQNGLWIESGEATIKNNSFTKLKLINDEYVIYGVFINLPPTAVDARKFFNDYTWKKIRDENKDWDVKNDDLWYLWQGYGNDWSFEVAFNWD